MICPDLQEGEGFFIKGDSDSIETHSYQFQIDKCNQDLQTKMGRPKCHSDYKINTWIKDVNVQSWSLNKVIDFDYYGDDPTYWVNEMLKSNLLHEEYIVTNYLYIANNLYDNQDHWWPFSNRFDGNFYKIDKIKERPKYG